MFWEEEDDKTLPFKAPEAVFDVLFGFECKALPIDHAWSLSQEICNHLPWIKDAEGAGIHQIHVAESNNGWMRPESDNSLLFPSKRSKLSIRIPANKFSDMDKLVGAKLNIDGHMLSLKNYKKKVLSNAGVIFARYVLIDKKQSETEFLETVAKEIKIKTNTTVKKMLCGKDHMIKTPDGILNTKHLMIADLDDETSTYIQQYGIGGRRDLGCGLFLPHKSIKTLKPTE